MSFLGFLLILQLCVGSFLTFGLVSREAGSRYFLIHGLGAIGLSVFVYLWIGRDVAIPRAMPWTLAFWIVGGAYCFRQWFPLWLAAGLSGILAIVFSVSKLGPLAIVNSLLSTSLLGFSLMAMLLGHWYLTQPKLSIKELSRLTYGYLVVLGLRFSFAMWQITALCAERSEMEIYRYLMGSTPGIFLLMRIVWGILAPMGLAYFVWKTVKLRSTQSATGILYVVDLAVLTGETVSLYLMLNYGILA